MDTIIEMKNIHKSFFLGTDHELEVLHGIDLSVRQGEFISIVGASGSGKSTLLFIIGALDKQTEGEYLLNGLNVQEAGDNKLAEIRNSQIGFVFQNFNLIPRCNALKNVELPMLYAGVEKHRRLEHAVELMKMVDMYDRCDHQPSELSGGQKQRVAIARALANDPSIILADEPTGALDSRTGRLVMDLFHRINQVDHKTIVLITHSQELAAETDRQIVLKDGVICS